MDIAQTQPVELETGPVSEGGPSVTTYKIMVDDEIPNRSKINLTNEGVKIFTDPTTALTFFCQDIDLSAQVTLNIICDFDLRTELNGLAIATALVRCAQSNANLQVNFLLQSSEDRDANFSRIMNSLPENMRIELKPIGRKDFTPNAFNNPFFTPPSTQAPATPPEAS